MSSTVKPEPMVDDNIKAEPVGDTPSPYMDDIEEAIDEAGDLDFGQAQQNLWLSHVPKSLWDILCQIGDNDEVEIGTLRVEGSEANPGRVSMMLRRDLPQLRMQPKEYNLTIPSQEKLRSTRPGSAFVFSEKDLPGYKSKTFKWDDVDEDGNPGQGRSYLYEKHKKELKKKENKGRFVPYTRRPILKHTAIAGTVAHEYEAVPVQNKEYRDIQDQHRRALLKPTEKKEAVYTDDDPLRGKGSMLSMSERANINKASQAKKQAAKDNRAARIEKHELIDRLLNLFRRHRIWGLRDLKAEVQQPESYLRSVLEEIAFMWKHGDFNGKWELKDEYKQQDSLLLNAGGVAPKAEDSDMDKSGLEDDDDDAFVDV